MTFDECTAAYDYSFQQAKLSDPDLAAPSPCTVQLPIFASFQCPDGLPFTTVTSNEDGSEAYLCQPCPEGGFCPGGPRVWPTNGYWSENERDVPQKCKVASACPGISQEEQTKRQQRLLLDIGNDNQKLREMVLPTDSCSTGYEGQLCGTCQAGWYAEGDLCMNCADTGKSVGMNLCDR